jgi:hypothetical protein
MFMESVNSSLQVINITLNAIISFILLALIITTLSNRIKTPALNSSFIPLVTATVFSALADMVGWFTNGNLALSHITFVANSMFYIFNFIALYLSLRYLMNYISSKTAPPRGILGLVNTGCVIGVGIVVANFFTPILFEINESGIYERLDTVFFALSQFIGLMCMASCAGVIIKYHKLFDKREFRIFIIGYTVFPIAALGFQAAIYGITLINVSVGAFAVLMYFNSYRGLEDSIEGYEQSADQSRKNELQAKTFERFLFGFIIPLRELIEYNPDRAFDAINRLLDYKKYSQIDEESCSLIPFEQELKQAKSFAELEKICYGIHLSFVFDAKFTDFEIPAMTLIPLIDNAVIHGLAEAESGEIKILTDETAEGILIEISDNGIGCDPGRVKIMKKSIAIISERLRIMSNGELRLISKPGDGAVVKILLKQ